MAVYLQDEQEIDNFKYFWNRYGRWLFAILVILAIVYFGWGWYQSHARSQNEQAADSLEAFVTQDQANNEVGTKKALFELQSKYAHTIAATEATFIMASKSFDQGKYDEAIKHLQWVQKQQSNDYIQALVAQRLAIVYLQQHKYDLALKSLDVKTPASFKPLLLDVKGDVLVAQHKTQEATLAYQEALKLLPKDAMQRDLIQMKVDALG